MTEILKKKRSLSALTAAVTVLILANPTVRLIDILPDFIASVIMIRWLDFYKMRAPYFAECRDSFVKLLYVSLLRGPAFLIAAAVKSGNVADNDITVLLTFVFGIIECAILLFAVRDLFSGIFYVGMRGCDAALSPFSVSKKGRIMTPEALRALTYIFILFRAAAGILPEMLLLSRSEIIGSTTKLFNFRALYPYFVVILVPSVIIFSFVLARRFYLFAKSLSVGEFYSTADSLVTSEGRLEIENKSLAGDKKLVLTLFIIAAALSFDIRLTNFEMADLLPDFLSGIVIFFALLKISRETKKATLPLIASCIYTLISVVSFISERDFLYRFGYEALEKNEVAKAEYASFMNLAFIEFIALGVTFFLIARALILFLKKHTRIESGGGESISAVKYIKKMRIKVSGFAFLAILGGFFKFLFAVFNYNTTTTLVATDVGTEAVSAGSVPWFGTVVFISSLCYLGYTVYLFNSFKEEIDLKYS